MRVQGQAIFERWEDFSFGGAKHGALYRRYCGGVLTSRIAFTEDDGTYRAESVIHFSDDGQSWVRSSFQSGHTTEAIGAPAKVDREAAGLERNSLPSYGEVLLLLDMIASGSARADFLRLSDSEPTPDNQVPSTIEAVGEETVQLETGFHSLAMRLEVKERSKLVAIHWTVGGELVKSDWNGAESFLVAGADEALRGLDGDTATFLTRGFSAP